MFHALKFKIFIMLVAFLNANNYEIYFMQCKFVFEIYVLTKESRVFNC
jgi:hypothetical protein